MASSALPSLLLLVIAVSALTAAARPCKTIFFFTTTTTTSYFPTNSHTNPNFKNFPLQSNSPKSLTLFFTTVNTANDKGPLDFHFTVRPTDYFSFRSHPFPRFVDEEAAGNHQIQKRSVMPGGFYSSITRGSIRDIISVVGAILFGVGCGALTAATMYLVCSLTSRFGSEEESDDDDVSPRKVGYVVIPDDDIDAMKKAAQAAQAKMEAVGN